MLYNRIILLFICTYSFSQVSIFQLARNGSVEDFKKFVSEYNVSIDTLDTRGISPLILAVYNQNNEVAKFIIKNSSNINYTSRMGNALMASVYKNNLEIFELLVNQDINFDSVDENGNSALMLAVSIQNIFMTKKLLELNANRSLVNKNNKNAFQLALETQNNELIKLFNQ